MSSKLIVGVSVGRGEIHAVICTEDFTIIEKETRPLPPKIGKESIAARIEKTVSSLPSYHMAAAVGVAIPATFDVNGKKIIESSIEELKDVNIYQLLSKKINLPIFIFRRNFCSILAEQAFGLAKEVKNAVYVEIGRDIEAAFLIAGKIYRGSNNAAGQIKETIVDITREKRNSAGSFGALISGEGIEALTGQSIYQILKDNPKSELISQHILRDLKESLLTGLFNIKLIFDPEVFIVGGDIVKNFALFQSIFKDFGVPVKKSDLGEDAAALGAAVGAYNAINQKLNIKN